MRAARISRKGLYEHPAVIWSALEWHSPVRMLLASLQVAARISIASVRRALIQFLSPNPLLRRTAIRPILSSGNLSAQTKRS